MHSSRLIFDGYDCIEGMFLKIGRWRGMKTTEPNTGRPERDPSLIVKSTHESRDKIRFGVYKAPLRLFARLVQRVFQTPTVATSRLE